MRSSRLHLSASRRRNLSSEADHRLGESVNRSLIIQHLARSNAKKLAKLRHYAKINWMSGKGMANQVRPRQVANPFQSKRKRPSISLKPVPVTPSQTKTPV